MSSDNLAIAVEDKEPVARSARIDSSHIRSRGAVLFGAVSAIYFVRISIPARRL